MLYRRKSFSVSSVSSKQNAPRGAYCAEKGHSGADSRGRCFSCGEVIVEAPELVTAHDVVAVVDVNALELASDHPARLELR